jgi:hypothetical protein
LPTDLSARNKVKAETLVKVRPATRGAVAPGYTLQVLARSSLWAFRFYPWPKPARSLVSVYIIVSQKKVHILPLLVRVCNAYRSSAICNFELL